MAGIKRKQDKSHSVDRKKPKVSKEESAKRKKSTPLPPPSPPLLEEDDTSENEEFGGFSDDNEDGKANSSKGPEKSAGEGKKNPDGSSKSKEAHAEQKRMANERKLAKPNANILIRAKKIWEQLRRRQLVGKQRKELITELAKLIKGHVKDLVFKHDASRIVQTALKYGDQATKSDISLELKGTYVAMAQSSYGKYLVVKMMHYGSPEMKKMIVEEFYGSVRKLIKHREASFVIEDAFREFATPAQKAVLLREFYGVEYAIFKDEKNSSLSLSDILEKSPEKRAVIMKSLFDLISGVVTKGAIFFTILHKAMLEYLLNVKPETTEVTEFIEMVKEHVAEIAFTKDGTQVVIRCLALGTAKDRKLMIKALKPVTAQLASNETAYLVLLTAFEVVDDTVLVTKSFIPEFESALLDLAVNKFGRIPLLYPYANRKPRLLPPSALPSLKEIDKIRESTSKKDPSTRQSELRTHFSPVLIKGVTDHVEELVTDPFGCQFITEVLLGTTGEKTEALEAIADIAGGDVAEESHLVATAAGGRMLKTLVAGGHYNNKEKKVDVISPPLLFGNLLYAKIKPQIIGWATGPGSFVIEGLLGSEGFTGKEGLKQGLREDLEKIKHAAETGNKGSEFIVAML